MSYTRPIADLASSVRGRGGFHLPRPSDPDLNQYLNESYAELYDIIVDSDRDRFASEDVVPIVVGASSYDLPDDHLRTLGISVADSLSESGRRALRMVDWAERDIYTRGELSSRLRDSLWSVHAGQVHLLPAPRETGTLYHSYAPTPADLDDSTDLVSAQGREYVILGAMIRCAESEGQPADTWEARRERTAIRIRSQLHVQRAEPLTISDVYVYGPTGVPRRRR